MTAITRQSFLQTVEARKGISIALGTLAVLAVAVAAVALGAFFVPSAFAAVGFFAANGIYFAVGAGIFALGTLIASIRLALVRMKPFTVCTYNLGSTSTDYIYLCKYLETFPHITSKAEQDAFQLKYEQIKVISAQQIESMAHVFLLQEVGDDNSPLVDALSQKGFHIAKLAGGIYDSAIALNPQRFTNVVNHSRQLQLSDSWKKDVAIATADDTLTGETVCFVSAHVPGLDLEDPKSTDASAGDGFCQQIVQIVQNLGARVEIVGADMNASPEIWGARFDAFKNDGYKVKRSGVATNVCPSSADLPERELDYFFVKNGSRYYKRSAVQGIELGFDDTINASDHVPVFMEIN